MHKKVVFWPCSFSICNINKGFVLIISNCVHKQTVVFDFARRLAHTKQISDYVFHCLVRARTVFIKQCNAIVEAFQLYENVSVVNI